MGDDIDFVNNCTYLVINIDFKLLFDKFFNKLKASVLHKMYIFGRICKFLTKDAAICIFKSMALPYFEYGSIFLEICNNSQLDKLEKIFIRGIKLATNNFNNLPSRNFYDSVNLLPLKYRRYISICKLLQRKINRKEIIIQNPPNNMVARLQAGPTLEWPHVSNDKIKRFLPHLGPTIWNSLPNYLRKIEYQNKFNTEIRKYFRVQYNQNQEYDV